MKGSVMSTTTFEYAGSFGPFNHPRLIIDKSDHIYVKTEEAFQKVIDNYIENEGSTINNDIEKQWRDADTDFQLYLTDLFFKNLSSATFSNNIMSVNIDKDFDFDLADMNFMEDEWQNRDKNEISYWWFFEDGSLYLTMLGYERSKGGFARCMFEDLDKLYSLYD